MTDRSGGEGRSAQLLQVTPIEVGLGLFLGRPETTGIPGLIATNCFTFTTAGDSSHCTEVWGRGKVLQILLFPYPGSQEMVVAEWVIRIIAVLLAVI